MIDSLDQGAIIVDQSGCVVTVNKWFKDILGYEKHEIIGLSHRELFKKLFSDTGIDYSDFSRNFLKVVNLKKTLKFIRTLTDKYGSTFTVESSLHPLTDERGSVKGLLCFMKEIDDSILYNIAKNINSSLALKDVLKNANKEIVEQPNLSSNAIFLLDQTRDCLDLVVCNGWNDEDLVKIRLKLGEGIPGLITQQRRPIYVENLHTDDGIAEAARQMHFDKSSIGYPMIFKDTMLGVIAFDARSVRPFSKRELQIFEHIADFVAMVVYNAKVYEKVLLMANTDGLTGLLNHRHFHEVMQKEVEIAAVTKRNLSMLLLNVDQFKTYNNTYGYTAGDKLLKEIATVLKSAVGFKGEIVRFGGDEFAILLPNTNIEQATIIAEEIVKLSDSDMKILRYGACLHDIGKIEINREILNKAGRLTEEEFAQIKKHPENGVDLLKPIKSLGNIIPAVKYHHERYDGSGYPDNLKGEEIPFLARIICIADSFDAIISKRPYRTAKSISYAIEELEKCAGTQFDPKIVKAFVKTLKEQYYEFSRTVM